MRLLGRMLSTRDARRETAPSQTEDPADPIYDRNGHAVGWLYGRVIYDSQQRYRARLHGTAVYSFNARLLGHLDCGVFRDQAGFVVAFVSDPEGRLVFPRVEAGSLPRSLPTPPIPALPSQAPAAAAPRPDWSPLAWDEFLRGLES